jgi:hypothetical protein
MSVTYISATVRRLVIARAGERCEYCLLPATAAFFPHEVDHIIAEKHGGATEAENLAYTCWRCNRHKGTDLGSFDPATHDFSLLYHPRTQHWLEHFVLHDAEMQGLTAAGRTTVRLLQLNSPERLVERQLLLENGHSFMPFQEGV